MEDLNQILKIFDDATENMYGIRPYGTQRITKRLIWNDKAGVVTINEAHD